LKFSGSFIAWAVLFLSHSDSLELGRPGQADFWSPLDFLDFVIVPSNLILEGFILDFRHPRPLDSGTRRSHGSLSPGLSGDGRTSSGSGPGSLFIKIPLASGKKHPALFNSNLPTGGLQSARAPHTGHLILEPGGFFILVAPRSADLVTARALNSNYFRTCHWNGPPIYVCPCDVFQSATGPSFTTPPAHGFSWTQSNGAHITPVSYV
jgi:hypothetical protein